eukprot:6186896-Pleurochrysis_carterae.AAC.1
MIHAIGAVFPSECAHVRAVVEPPHARRLVARACNHMLAVRSNAHRGHFTAMPLESAHLRAFGGGGHVCAVSSPKSTGLPSHSR